MAFKLLSFHVERSRQDRDGGWLGSLARNTFSFMIREAAYSQARPSRNGGGEGMDYRQLIF